MKKLTFVLLSAGLALSLAACGADSDSVSTSTTTRITDTPTSITTEAVEQGATTTEDGIVLLPTDNTTEGDSVEDITTTTTKGDGFVVLPSAEGPFDSEDGTTTETTIDDTTQSTDTTNTTTTITTVVTTKSPTNSSSETTTTTTIKTTTSTTKSTTKTTTTTTTTMTTTKKPTTVTTTTKTTTTTKKPTTTTTTTTTTTKPTTRPTVAPNPEMQKYTAEELEVIDMINEARKAEGLSALKINYDLKQAAEIRVRELEVKFAHQRPDGKGFWEAITDVGLKYSYASESIASIATEDCPASELQDIFMESEGHRANILSPKATEVAVAVRRVNGFTLIVELFCTPYSR